MCQACCPRSWEPRTPCSSFRWSNGLMIHEIPVILHDETLFLLCSDIFTICSFVTSKCEQKIETIFKELKKQPSFYCQVNRRPVPDDKLLKDVRSMLKPLVDNIRQHHHLNMLSQYYFRYGVMNKNESKALMAIFIIKELSHISTNIIVFVSLQNFIQLIFVLVYFYPCVLKTS